MCAANDKSEPSSRWRKAITAARLLLRPSVARKVGTLVTEGYLAKTGWVRSVQRGEILDADGAPVPWTTFPFIDFITPRLEPGWRIFEFGAGASTRFFARRVTHVMAVEHNPEFASQLSPLLPPNARVVVQAAGTDAYAQAVNAESAPWDLISIDGVDREACVRAALPCLAPSGVLVLDDAERAEYAHAIAHLKSAGFRAVEFWGLAPGRVERKCTAVFYRPDNVLGL